MSKKRNVDRLSRLPDSLLHHILSSLNTKQVVQTCILSERWKLVWTHIPTLNFDFDSYPFKGSTIRDTVTKETSFNHFILSVISERSGPIKKLSYTPSSMDCDPVLAEMLMCYARRHMVQEFCIKTRCSDSYDWKWLLSKWESLTVLKIKANKFMDDWRDLMLPSLRILEIESNIYADIDHNGITISGCPNLESLVLVYYYCDLYIISAPKLENLEIRLYFQGKLNFPKIDLDTLNLKHVTFKNVLPTLICDSDISYLEKVNLTIADFYFTPQCCYMKEVVDHLFELLRVFHNTRSLTMPLKGIEVLFSVSSPLREILSFHNLRHLMLKRERTKNNMLHLPIIPSADFLKCPNLKSMVVDLNPGSLYNTSWGLLY